MSTRCATSTLTAPAPQTMAESGVKATLRLLFRASCVLSAFSLFFPLLFLCPLPLQCVLYQSLSRPLPCMSGCVAAGAVSFSPFFLTLSKGMDSGSWRRSISAPERTPALLCRWATGHGVLLPSLRSPPFLVPWACLINNLGKRNIKVGRKRHSAPWPGAALPVPAPPYPAFALLGCLPTCLLGERSTEAGASDQEKKKKNDEGWQG